MPKVGTAEMFKKANDGAYAIGAFNVNNMEIIQGIVEAAAELNTSLILQVSAGARKYARHEYLIKLVEAALLTSDIPIALHLDHGDTFELCKSVIDGGFSSVMIDGSKYSLEDNIAITKKVVDYAHERGIPVEAELGKLAGVEDDVNVAAKDAVYTDPQEAVEFVERTGCDSLAIAIGTSHGAYKFKTEPKLNFKRLEEIQKLLPEKYPLVLHGSSTVIPEFVKLCNDYGGDLGHAMGVPESMIKKAAAMNVAKVNIDTDLRLAMTGTIRKEFVANPSAFDPRKYLGPARDAIREMVKRKIKILGCDGSAAQ
ncbi:class II fructose-1,6-bisphosphate aldolase [bacterium]|nr:class II fructose-1,6-bisphosphate aldolase [bacterium]